MTIRIAASFTRFPYGIGRRIRREIRLPVKFRFGQRLDTGCVRRRVTRRRAHRHRFRRAQCEPHGFQPHAYFGSGHRARIHIPLRVMCADIVEQCGLLGRVDAVEHQMDAIILGDVLYADFLSANWGNAFFAGFNAVVTTWAIVSYIGVWHSVQDMVVGLVRWFFVPVKQPKAVRADMPTWEDALYFGDRTMIYESRPV